MDEQNQGQTYGAPAQGQYYQPQPEQGQYYQPQPAQSQYQPEQNGYYQPQSEQGQYYQPPTPVKGKKKFAIIAVAAVAAIAVIVLLCTLLFGNNKATYPVEFMTDMEYGKITSLDKALEGVSNGIETKELKNILKIVKKGYGDKLEELEDQLKEIKDEMKDKYGSNFKYSVKIDEQEKLDKDEVKEYKEKINDMGETLQEAAEKIKDLDDFDTLTDNIELSESEIKKIATSAGNIGKTLKKAKVTEGKTISYTVTIKGSELDEPEELEKEMVVLKVNGKWISAEVVEALSSLSRYASYLDYLT